MNALQKATASSICIAFHTFFSEYLTSVSSDETYEEIFAKFKENILLINGNVEFSTHDDIFLAEFSFDQNKTHHIFAIGELSEDAYTVYPNYTEEHISESVCFWKRNDNFENPVLRYSITLDEHPTVDLNELKVIFNNANFDVNIDTPSRHTNPEWKISFMIQGRKNTDAERINISVDVIRDEETKELILDGYSTSINNIGWDEYHVVIGDDLSASLHTSNLANDETEKLFQRLNIFEIAKKLI